MAGPNITLGIDLGNSFSSAAAWVNGRMFMISDSRGEACIPSVVFFPPEGTPVVGAYADRMRQVDPENTVSGIKRILGRDFESPEVKVMAANSAVHMEAAPNGLPVLKLRGKEYTPQQIAGVIFEQLKELAERRFRAPVKKAAITLPASATDAVRKATVKAAESAGLEVVRTLSEPEAGAYALQMDEFSGQRNLLVYDFGGGTFDVTVMRQENKSFKLLSLGGDSCLGGDDLDRELAQLAAGHIYKRVKVDLTKDVVRWDQLIRTAELTKKALSALDSAPLRLKDAYSHRGKSRNLELTVSRGDVDARWRPLVERSTQVTAKALMKAGLRPDKLDEVVLVGGTTYVPLVQRHVRRLLRKKGVQDGDPQTAVACGAALAVAKQLSAAA